MNSVGCSSNEVSAVAELYMTIDEIVRSYQQAADKDAQINILSQLNGCRRKTILHVLGNQEAESTVPWLSETICFVLCTTKA